MDMKKSIKFSSLACVLMLILMFTYQNCQFDESTSDPPSQRNFPADDTNEQVSNLIDKGALDPNCISSSEYNACLFLKNPVAQNTSPFNPPITFFTDLSSIQLMGLIL